MGNTAPGPSSSSSDAVIPSVTWWLIGTRIVGSGLLANLFQCHSWATSTRRSPLGVTSRTHKSVMMRSTTARPVRGNEQSLTIL